MPAKNDDLHGSVPDQHDIALLLIDVGHDVRATRILLGRQASHDTLSVGLLDPSAGDRRHVHTAAAPPGPADCASAPCPRT